MIDKTKSLPDSVLSLYRAQILILLKEHEPTTRLHLHTFGFTKKYVNQVFRELINDELVIEGYHLYRTTDLGKQVVGTLKTIPIVTQWLETDKEKVTLERPDITKL